MRPNFCLQEAIRRLVSALSLKGIRHSFESKMKFKVNHLVLFTLKSADEEAGGAAEPADEQDGANGVNESQPLRQHTSLTHRLSSLYETLLSKAAPKKAASAGQANNGADPETKVKTGLKKRKNKLCCLRIDK